MSSPLHVLVVDDDYRVADLHAQCTRSIPGFEVVGMAHTAATAIHQAQELRPDLVLLDQYLPDGRGTDIVGQLGCDVIMLTAASDADAVRAALGRGVLNYLVKPFSPDELGQRLRAYARYREHLRPTRRSTRPTSTRRSRCCAPATRCRQPPGKGARSTPPSS